MVQEIAHTKVMRWIINMRGVERSFISNDMRINKCCVAIMYLQHVGMNYDHMMT